MYVSRALALSRSGAPALWRSRALALSRSRALALSRSRALALSCVLTGGLTTRDARAEIDDVTCAVQPNNSMRFDCVIRMVGNGRVKLGHRRVVDGDWKWVASTESLPLHGLTVYSVVPGETYSYRVEDPNAYIMASWNFPFDGANPEKYACNSRGSARLVPGTAVPSSDPGTVPHYYGVMLAMCAKTKSVVDLVADDGSPAPLGYELTVAPTACLLDPNRVDNGWHREYPIMSLGQQ